MTVAQQTGPGKEPPLPSSIGARSTGQSSRSASRAGTARGARASHSAAASGAAGSTRASHARRRRLATVLLAAAVLVLAVFGAAPAASAHDAVETTSPKDGSTVASMPEKVTITLSNTPGALGSAIEINDASGRNWAQGPVQVVDHVVTQPLKPGTPAGKYTVLWRLVSSDSHPIDGTFSFTASGGSGGGASVSTQIPLQPAAPASAQTVGGFPWGIAVVIAVLVVLVAGLGYVAKRRLGREDSREDG